MTKKRFETVAITVTQGQLDYITQQTQGLRDRSRWIRDAISMRMMAETNKQVNFAKDYSTKVLNDAIEVAQDKLDEGKYNGNPVSS
jgi:hypothetical protein